MRLDDLKDFIEYKSTTYIIFLMTPLIVFCIIIFEYPFESAAVIACLLAFIFNLLRFFLENWYTRKFSTHLGIIAWQNKYEETVAKLMFLKRRKRNKKISWLIQMAAILILLFSRIPRFSYTKEMIFVVAGIIIALWIQQAICEYRIIKGYYGTNSFECKELIKYILKESDKSKFIDKDGKPKKVLSPEDIKAITIPIRETGFEAFDS